MVLTNSQFKVLDLYRIFFPDFVMCIIIVLFIKLVLCDIFSNSVIVVLDIFNAMNLQIF